MSELVVIGNNEFVMGFELIGLNKVFEAETSQKLKESFVTALNDSSVGIIVTNDTAVSKLEINFRRTIENSITPVVVVLSTKVGAQDNLRDMIKKVIGIDLWNK